MCYVQMNYCTAPYGSAVYAGSLLYCIFCQCGMFKGIIVKYSVTPVYTGQLMHYTLLVYCAKGNYCTAVGVYVICTGS
jgi:hypothetical protein